MTNTSNARKRSSASARKPVNTTRDAIPSSRASASNSPRSAPSPTTKKRTSGRRAHTIAAARNRSFCALCGASAATLPTAKTSSPGRAGRTASRGWSPSNSFQVDPAARRVPARRQCRPPEERAERPPRWRCRPGAAVVFPLAEEAARRRSQPRRLTTWHGLPPIVRYGPAPRLRARAPRASARCRTRRWPAHDAAPSCPRPRA